MTEKLLNDLITWAQAQPEIMALYLYGSQAEGRANDLSDVDVAVLVQNGYTQIAIMASGGSVGCRLAGMG